MGLLDSNPDLKNETSMGVIVDEYKILYDSFDGREAAGNIRLNGTTFCPSDVN